MYVLSCASSGATPAVFGLRPAPAIPIDDEGASTMFAPALTSFSPHPLTPTMVEVSVEVGRKGGGQGVQSKETTLTCLIQTGESSSLDLKISRSEKGTGELKKSPQNPDGTLHGILRKSSLALQSPGL